MNFNKKFVMDLNKMKSTLEKEIFGETPAGCCVNCKQPFSTLNVHTNLGWKETSISKLCEDCFDEITKEPQE